MIGYRNIPITSITLRGPLTVTIGLTYIREQDSIEIWDSWMNPVIAETLDLVDRTIFIAKASTVLTKTLRPIEDHHAWEVLTYG